MELPTGTVGELIPVASMTSKGLIDADTIQGGCINVAERDVDVLYKLTNDAVSSKIARAVGCLLSGFANFAFNLAIACSGSNFRNVSIKLINGNANYVKSYADDNGIYYKKAEYGNFTLTLISCGYPNDFNPLFTPNPNGNDTSNMTEIVIN